MIIKAFVVTMSRALGVVLVFIYTVGTVLVFVGIIDTTNHLDGMVRLAFLGWPIMVIEKKYIDQDSEEGLSTDTQTHAKKK